MAEDPSPAARYAAYYQASILPAVSRRLDGWAERAAAIPNPDWAKLATESLERKCFHAAGGSLFACLPGLAGVPLGPVLDRMVALQVAVDFLDDVSDRGGIRDLAQVAALHRYLFGGRAPQPTPLAETGSGGYFEALRAAAGADLSAEPNFALVAPWLARSLALCGRMQTINQLPDERRIAFAQRWADHHRAADLGLTWQEHQAGHGSTIPVFLALALASLPHQVSPAEVVRLRAAYEPWLVALHIMLDSVLDLPDDLVTGDLNFVRHFPTRTHRQARLVWLTRQWAVRAHGLAQADFHRFVFLTMVQLYLGQCDPAGARQLAEAFDTARAERNPACSNVS